MNFKVEARVARHLSDNDPDIVIGYSLDLRVFCQECNTQFEFLGDLPAGYNPRKAMVSVDSTELRIPIAPSTGLLSDASYAF